MEPSLQLIKKQTSQSMRIDMIKSQSEKLQLPPRKSDVS